MNMEIEIKNENELLRIFEYKLKDAKSDSEKNRINSYIDKTKNELSKHKAAIGMN